MTKVKMNKKSIFIKIFSGYVLTALAIASLMLFFSFGTIKKYYINTLENDLKDLCEAVQPQVLSLVRSGKTSELDKFIKQFGVQTHKRVTVIDIDGVVLADSEANPKTMVNHKTRPEVIQVLNGATGTSIRYSSTIQENMLYVAVPIKDSGMTTIGILRISMFLKGISALLNTMLMHLVNITLIVLAVCLFVAFIFSRSLSVPIRKLTAASEKIASGDFNVKVSITNEDELQGLAESFNQMSGKINSLFNELSGKKEELNTIINSITEGLFVIDLKDKIKLSNAGFKAIAGSLDTDNRYYWEVLRVQGLKELIERAKEKLAVTSDEISIAEKTYACSMVPLASGNEFVIVLHDITQIKNLEKKKKEFVANVSHELRTPLTAIKGFAETLEDETSKNGRHFLEVIKNNADRLIHIVQDLLLLSQLEEKEFKIETDKTDIKAIIESAAKIFETKAKEKNIAININMPEKVRPIESDEFRLEQVFVNLIDNAVKYTDKGSVDVSLKQDKEQTTITVSDTGIGIPKESLPFIFERFYVVDKSRTRKSGGTGLGLAIVKHIVLLHNGSIKVDSVSGAGSTFTIVLPN
jgi:two-component system phosphate regulon sensor histidine kinase PhoR